MIFLFFHGLFSLTGENESDFSMVTVIRAVCSGREQASASCSVSDCSARHSNSNSTIRRQLLRLHNETSPLCGLCEGRFAAVRKTPDDAQPPSVQIERRDVEDRPVVQHERLVEFSWSFFLLHKIKT